MVAAETPPAAGTKGFRMGVVGHGLVATGGGGGGAGEVHAGGAGEQAERSLAVLSLGKSVAWFGFVCSGTKGGGCWMAYRFGFGWLGLSCL